VNPSFVQAGRIDLTLEGSRAVLDAAVAAADAIGTPMCIAVTDAAGHLLAFYRMDGARTSNIGLALTKAVSASTRRRATADEFRPDEAQVIRKSLAMGTDRMTAMPGGIPIVVEGQVIGAIGVSNGHGEEDIAVARAGIAALTGPER
jgi:glc operon protein GlcG